MGLFDKFNKNKTSDNGIPGPLFLEGWTENIISPKDLQPHEWRRKLISPSGQSKFKIKFYGDRPKDSTLIFPTEFAPCLVFAVSPVTNEEILIFDGCKHGYDAMFCNSFTDDEINNRPVTNIYSDRYGCDIFEITLSTYNGIDFDEEFSDEVDENGQLEIMDGKKMRFEEVKRNGYDTFQAWGTNEKGKIIAIVSEELS